jgi:hypothetical protein
MLRPFPRSALAWLCLLLAACGSDDARPTPGLDAGPVPEGTDPAACEDGLDNDGESGTSFCTLRCDGMDIDDRCLDGYGGPGRPVCRLMTTPPGGEAYWQCLIACVGPGTDGTCPPGFRRCNTVVSGFCE